LSGGLDSSAIVCEARRQRRERAHAAELHAISVIFPDAPERDLPRIDERAFVANVTGHGGLRTHTVRGDRLSPLTDVQRMLNRVDEPFFSPNLYLHWAMYGTAARAGARVFLDGFDGDSAVSHGFGRLNALARAGGWDGFENEVRAFASNRGTHPTSVLPHFGFPYLEELAREGRAITWWRAAAELRRRFQLTRRDLYVRQGLIPACAPVLRRATRALGRSSTGDGLLRPAVARRLAELVDRSASPTRALGERAAHIEALEQPAYQLSLEIADKCAAAFGVEPRYPFFDRRVLEFCVGLPDEQKFAGGWPRLVLRRAMEGVLPPEIQWRSTKGDLSSNFRRRLLECDPGTVERADPGVLAPYVNVRRLRERLAHHHECGGEMVSDAESCLLFRAVVLSAWFSGLRDERSAPVAPEDRDPQAPVAA
jgi:asparagine synthase (glutamine-hydrolysing)